MLVTSEPESRRFCTSLAETVVTSKSPAVKMARTPNLIKNIINNFIGSITPRTFTGKHVGTDYLGNKYFEIPANPSRGKRKPARYFENDSKDEGYDRERPPEWDSWLRHRRSEPPTEEEINKNLAIIKMKQENAAILEAKHQAENAGKLAPVKSTHPKGYPKYEEYH